MIWEPMTVAVTPDLLQVEARRRKWLAVGGASLAAIVAALGVSLALLGLPAIQPPLSAVNLLLIAFVHLGDEPGSPLHVPQRVRYALLAFPLLAATFAGLWLAVHWPFDVCRVLWPLPTDLEPTPACVAAVWLLALSRLAAERPQFTRFSAMLAVAALPPALTSLIGWFFGPTLVSSVVSPLHLRVPSAIIVLSLVAARMASPLQVMPYRWLLGGGPTAVWLRRLLLAVLVAIPSLMLLHDHAVAAKWYQPNAAAMISTVLLLAIGITGILWSASRLHRAETLLRNAQLELEQRVADRTHELALANQALNRDIAERRRMDEQLRASRERLRAVTESAIDPILTVDAEGRIVQWNQAATTFFGYPESAILGARLELLLPELAAGTDDTREFAQRIAGWLGQTRRCAGRRSSGERMDLEVSLAMWQDRESRFYSIIGRDVSERMRAEAELTAARDAAEAANRSKSEFLANMSHEIRTPMNVILGMAELIGASDLNEDQRRYLRTTREAGDHLLEIISDILDLSKIEAGKMELDALEFDLRELAEQGVDFLAPRAYAKHLEIVCHLDPALPSTVVGDPQRLRQVLVNLLGNAVKFTDFGYVELYVDVVGPDRLHLKVRDTGCGIPPDKVEVIFESFTQADTSSTRRHGGTGLGLAISRQLVEQMGGRLTVKSVVDEGSTFHVDVPLPFLTTVGWSLPQALSADPELAQKLHHCRVMVAGGQPIFRQTLGGQLAQTGAIVTEVGSFAALVPQLRASEEAGRPCQLLLLDADMGEIDGFAAVQRIADAGLLQPPRIALTKASEDSEDMRRRQESAVAVILRKPVRQRALLEALAGALGMQRAHDAPVAAQVVELASTSRAVLVVDDASDNLRLMEAFLRDTAWHVETAEDGAEAVERWRDGQFDAILMDLQMPVMDGLAATREIRRLEAELNLTATPIIAVTAHALEEARAESLQAGCNAFLAKPLRRARLIEVLTELFFGTPHAVTPDGGPIEVEVDPLLLTLIPGFLEHRQEDVVTIENALKISDFAPIRLLGHSMKGSGGSYGFDVISRIGRDIEVGARERDSAAVRHALNALDDYLKRVKVR